MGKTKTSLTTESRKDMPPRGRGKKSLMLEAIRSVCDNEQEFLKRVVAIGLGGPEVTGKDEDGEDIIEFKASNPMLLNMVLNRIEPPLKATSPMVQFEFNDKAKPHEQAAQVLRAVSLGKISADIGHMFITSISSMLKIQEVTDIDERLKAMEEKIDQS